MSSSNNKFLQVKENNNKYSQEEILIQLYKVLKKSQLKASMCKALNILLHLLIISLMI